MLIYTRTNVVTYDVFRQPARVCYLSLRIPARTHMSLDITYMSFLLLQNTSTHTPSIDMNLDNLLIDLLRQARIMERIFYRFFEFVLKCKQCNTIQKLYWKLYIGILYGVNMKSVFLGILHCVCCKLKNLKYLSSIQYTGVRHGCIY